MLRLKINDYDMAFVDVGPGVGAGGTPLICIHGSLNDYRAWWPVMGPLSRGRRVIAPSLRHYFPEHWNGQGGSFTIAQHMADMIAFIEALDLGPIDLLGHSRGGHIAFRVAEERPDLLRRLVLAEPGGELDASLAPPSVDGAASAPRTYVAEAAAKMHADDINGGLRTFKDGVDGPGTWDGLPEADKQLRRDNAFTLLAQSNEQRQPFARSEAESIKTPTLIVAGANTHGALPIIARVLAEHIQGAGYVSIADATHVMFAQQPVAFSEAVLAFLDS
ncbi:alpha/beta hydrolase [Alphaproteobacteria bacterium]|jgi:esterase|nr:alpha/beta hydrolase [Alphaproteobacteria bacterium]